MVEADVNLNYEVLETIENQAWQYKRCSFT